MSLSAIAAAAPGPGSSVAPILKLGPGARPAGMGDAFVSVADDVNASAWNPAGLSLVPMNGVTFMHDVMYQGINYDFLGYAHPIGRGAGLGAHMVYAYTDAIAKTAEDAGGSFDPAHSGGTFRDSDLKLNLSGAATLMDWIHLGLGADYLQDRVGSDMADGMMGDLGVLLTPTPTVSFGMSLQNLGSRMHGGSRPPSYLRTGAAVHWQDFLIVALEQDHPWDSQHDLYSLGAEAWYQKVFALRLGFQLGRQPDAGAGRYTVGFGGRIGAFQVDYAYSPFGVLGDAHRLGVTYSFGAPREEVRRFAGFGRGEASQRPANAPASAAAPGENPIPLEPAPTTGEIEDHFNRAEELIMAKRYDEAKVELRLVVLQLSRHDRRMVRCHEQTGRIALAEGDQAAAKEAFRQALQAAQETGLSDASVADAYAGMGLCLLKEGNTDYASKFLQRSLALGPSPHIRRLVEAALGKAK